MTPPAPLPLVLALCASVAALASVLAHAEPSDLPAIVIAAPSRSEPVDFEREVLPALRDNCLACHNRTRAKADLVLETPADIRKGGANGPAAVAGKGDQSLLLRVSAHLEKPAMPPHENKVSAVDLTPTQLGLMKLWIDQGAAGEVRGAGSGLRWQPPPENLKPIYAVAVTADGRYAAAGRANAIDLYDLSAKRLVARLSDPAAGGAAHREFVESLAFSPDGNTLASGGFAEVKLWRRSSPAKRFTLAPAAAEGARVVAVSADGARVAVAAAGWPIELYDGATGRALRTLDASTAAPRGVAFSPDGTRLAIASADLGLRVSDVASGRLLAQAVVASDVAAIAWTQNGKVLALGGGDGVLRLWSADGATREVTVGHPITALATAGGDAACGSPDGVVRRFKLADLKPSSELSTGSAVVSLALRSDGKRLGVLNADGSVRLWDLTTGKAVAELQGDVTLLRVQAAAQRAATLAAGDVEHAKAAVARVEAERKAAADRLKAATPALAAAEKAASDKAAAVAASRAAKVAADNALAAAAGRATAQQATVDATESALRRVQDQLAEADADNETPAEQRAALQRTFDDEARALATAKVPLQALAADPRPKLAADAAVAALAKLEAEALPIEQARSNAQTELRLATAADVSATERIRSAQAASLAATAGATSAQANLAKAVSAAAAARTAVRAVAFSSDGSTLATVAGDAAAHLWDGDTGRPLETVPVSCVPEAVALTSDAIFVTRRDAVECWAPGGRWSLARTLDARAGPLVDRVGALAFSPDGRRLATGSGEPTRSGKVALWDVATGSLLRDCGDPHGDSVVALAFSPDGTLLASGGADRAARLIDPSSGAVLRTFEGHTGHVLGVAWKPDGRSLATAGADGQVKVWDAQSGDKKGAMGGFGKEVSAVAYVGVSGELIEASADGQVRLCDEAGQNAKNLQGTAPLIHAMATTPDGSVIVTGDEAGTLRVWRDPGLPPIATFNAPR